MKLAIVMPARTVVPGGVQRFAAELAPALVALGADVREYRVHPASGEARSTAALRGLTSLVQDHRRVHFDAVLTTFHWPPRVVGAPTFGVIHDLRSCPSGRFAPRRLARSAVTATWAAAFVPSTHVARRVTDLLGYHRTVVTGEGLDHLDRYFEDPPPQRSDILVVAGRAPHKRARLGLEAALLAANALGCGVTVVGVPEGDVPERVRVLADPDDRALAAAYQSALVAVVPSSYEGFGLSAGEALRAGTPVVHADDGTLADLVRAGGIAAHPTAPSFAEAIESAGLRASQLAGAARTAAAPYTWTTTARRVLDEIGARSESGAPLVAPRTDDPALAEPEST